MTLNPLGLVAALVTFGAVWLGHVAVRAIEARAPVLWPPIAGAVVLGLACEAGALLAGSLTVSAALGIAGVTLLWDGLEFVRQDRRVARGHAPANPHNPRHARYLAAGTATIANVLAREPEYES